jgi:hypothetical protein
LQYIATGAGIGLVFGVETVVFRVNSSVDVVVGSLPETMVQ